MKRRKFTQKAAAGLFALPLMTPFQSNANASDLQPSGEKVPLGMDAHSVSLMRWKARQLIEYAIELKVDSVLFNGLNYFYNLEDSYLKSLKDLLDSHHMRFHFGIGGLSINSPSYSSRFGNPKELIEEGLRVSKIFGTSSVNCKIGNIKDRYTDGGIVARMQELIDALRSMRSQIQDAGVKFAIENHAGDMRSEEVLQIVEAVGTDICGTMLDPGNSVWAMEDPVQHIEKLGPYALCTSVRDYRIWPSEKGATFQWTALGAGSMNLQHYTNRMSELCPGVPLHIETVSNRQNEIPFLTDEFWEGYPDLKAADMKDFHRMLRKGQPIDVELPPDDADERKFKQNQQKQELTKSIEYLKSNCPAISQYRG